MGETKKYATRFDLAQPGAEGCKMSIRIGITALVAIGLIWSLAAMSNWIPVNSAEMKSVATSPHVIRVSQVGAPGPSR